MRCKNCDYVLWNLKTRQCPECGTPFLPSEHEFAAQSVRFCCPHCDHPYFGTDARGLPEPRSFACVRCGQPVNVDEMVLHPGLGIEERQTRPDTMPWLDRRRRGRVRAWFEMIGKAMTAPGQLIASTPPDSALPQAWVYALVTTFIFVFVGAVPLALYGSVVGGMLFGLPSAFPRFQGAAFAFSFLILAAVALVLSVVLLTLWIHSAHAILRMTGKCEHGLRRTTQAMVYSSGANFLSAVPCCGWYLGWTWWVVSAILMVRRGQKVHGGRAVLAVGLLPGLILAAGIGAYVLMIASRPMWGSGRPTFWSQPQGSAAYQTGALGYCVYTMGAYNAGAGPVHPVELVINNTLNPWLGGAAVGTGSPFCVSGSRTTESDIPLGTLTLADFNSGGRSRQLALASTVLNNLPSGIIAQRFGDFVFVHYGAMVNVPDPQLWLVVMVPDPDVNGQPGMNDPVIIATGDQNVRQIIYGELARELKHQNVHRATLNLPPLPNPATVTHSQPAVQGPSPSSSSSP